jgi:A/G-specific adenine glycosylase
MVAKLPRATQRAIVHRQPTPHCVVTAAIIRRGNRVLITRRPLEGPLGGLWEFPGGKQERGETLAECLRRELHEELGIEVEVGERLMTVKHAYADFRITLHAFHCRLVRGRPKTLGVAGWRWVRIEELSNFVFPAADRKIIAALNEQSAISRRQSASG